jgi:hypothetical protein
MQPSILAVLLFATPAFAASMNTYASQLGGTNPVQLVPGEMPLLTTTYAGTPLQRANPGVLIFETVVAPIGYALSIGGQQFSIPALTYSCSSSSGCFFPASFTLPTFLRPTAGTLTVKISGSVTTFGFMFQSPVPQPTRVVLRGTGLAAIGWRRFRS